MPRLTQVEHRTVIRAVRAKLDAAFFHVKVAFLVDNRMLAARRSLRSECSEVGSRVFRRS